MSQQKLLEKIKGLIKRKHVLNCVLEQVPCQVNYACDFGLCKVFLLCKFKDPNYIVEEYINLIMI